MSHRKEAKNEANNQIIKMPGDNFIDKVMGDVSKKSAAQQIIFGAGSGW